jgi:SAM-dependent methyltransferase
MSFVFAFKELLRGKSLGRALMHERAKEETLVGTVVDIGGGRGASYLAYMKGVDSADVSGFDLQPSGGTLVRIDFETDALPRGDGSVDQVLMFNILEHIFHHQFLLKEASRILKTEGKLIGFVPFLINYHPDPHDYFRYTEEALRMLLAEAGFSDVRIERIGKGPFFVNFNNLVPSLSPILAAALLPIPYLLDTLLVRLRPNIGRRYPLGYFFVAKKGS